MKTMFEMFVTIVAALFATIYGLSQSVFMNGPYKNYYRLGLAAFIIVFYLAYRIYHDAKNSHISQLKVDLTEYLYYDKYTSPLYRIGYFISYLIQNILFDYTYMRRNFNFCKGLDVYDGGVSEYYIKFRNTWFRYLKLTLSRHRVSLKKLQAFAAKTKNDMIFDALETEDKKEIYKLFASETEAYYNEHHSVEKSVMKKFSNYSMIDSYYVKNLLRFYRVTNYVKKHEPIIIDYVNRQNLHTKKDVNDFKKIKF